MFLARRGDPAPRGPQPPAGRRRGVRRGARKDAHRLPRGARVVPGAVRRRVGRPVPAADDLAGREVRGPARASSSARWARCSRSAGSRSSPAGRCCGSCRCTCCTTSAPASACCSRRSVLLRAGRADSARTAMIEGARHARRRTSPHGADSEVGRLRTVMLHRPGPELKRLTPRNNDKLLFDGIPWVSRAQDEHDAFAADAARPRRRGALPHRPAHRDARAARTPATTRSTRRWRDLDLGDTMRGYLEGLLGDASPGGADRLPHRGHPQRRGARRLRPGHLPAGPRRLPHRPAAQPAVHPRLLGVGPRPGRDHLAGDAGPQARDPADRADLHPAPALRRHAADPRLRTSSTSRAATCCCSRRA